MGKIERLNEEYGQRYCDPEAPPSHETVEEDVARAGKALAKGQLVEALYATAWGLALEPRRADLLSLLDRTLAEADRKKVALPPEGAEPEALFQAMNAHGAWRHGDVTVALELLEEATSLEPELPFQAAWCPVWLDDDAALRALGKETALALLGELATQLPEPEDADDDDRAEGERLVRVAERAERALGLDRLADPHVYDLLTDALASAGRVDDALTLARSVHDARGDATSLKTLAVALRRAGQHDEAADAYVKAHDLDPADAGCLLDAAELRTAQQRWADALRLYERVLEREAHPWAVPSAHYCRFRLTGDAAALEALRAIGHRPPALGEDDLGALIEGLMGNAAAVHDPGAAAAELMAKLEGASDLDRDRARELLSQISGEVVPDDDERVDE